MKSPMVTPEHYLIGFAISSIVKTILFVICTYLCSFKKLNNLIRIKFLICRLIRKLKISNKLQASTGVRHTFFLIEVTF